MECIIPNNHFDGALAPMKVNHFIKLLKNYSYELSYDDHIWQIIFQNKKRWEYLVVNQYKDTFYLSALLSKIETLEVTKDSIQIYSDFGGRRYKDEENIKKWNELIIQAEKWLIVVKKDWLKANRFVWQNYPLKYRKGIVPTRSFGKAPLTLGRDKGFSSEK